MFDFREKTFYNKLIMYSSNYVYTKEFEIKQVQTHDKKYDRIWTV